MTSSVQVTQPANYVQVITGGLIGPQGPQGDTGGPQGPQGAQGAIGLQGPQGAQGPAGTGAQGARGLQGPQGPRGINGAPGAQGLRGATGPQGAHGATGVQGPRGATGVQGAKGPQGATGARGATGVQGPIGPQGAHGTNGTQGPRGYQGALGAQGPQGPRGSTGVQGARGPQGVIGPQGHIGNTGLTGAQGPKGLQGPQGPQGPQGSVGAQGPRGFQGFQGPAGGPQGPQGDVGLPGIVTINHGTDGTIARPDAQVVYWVGDVLPLNAIPTDFWYGPSNDTPQNLTAALAQANLYTDQTVAALGSAYIASAQPTSGEFAPHRISINGITPALVDGTLVGPVFKAEKTESLSQVSLYTGTVAAGATPSLARVGIYSIDPSTGNATLVASSANNTALFSATNTTYSIPLQASFLKTVGVYYFVGVLLKSVTSMPNFVGWVGPAGTSSETVLAIWPAISYKLSGQTDLPSTILGASLNTGATAVPIFRLS